VSIKSRVQKAKLAAKQVVLTHRRNAHVSHYSQRSLSDPAINYQQQVSWRYTDSIEDIKYTVVEVECHQVAGVGMPQPDCKGNNGTLCYHSLATLIKRANDQGQTLSLFDNFSDAARYANFGGKLVKIVSSQGEGYCWAVSK
jgi:hypothetical protein